MLAMQFFHLYRLHAKLRDVSYKDIQSNNVIKTLLNLLKVLALNSSGLSDDNGELLAHERVVKNFFWKVHDNYLHKEMTHFDKVVVDDNKLVPIKHDKIKEVVLFLLE